jgi:phosphomannomutase
MSGIFKAYDIRGAYPGELDEDLATRIGLSFVKLIKAERIVVGRDMRSSASSLASAFIRGAVAAGAEVADVGMTSTPQLYFAIIDGRFDGGAMITASHLPGGINGFKLCREAAIPLSGDRGLPELERMVREGTGADENGRKGSVMKVSFEERYIGRLAGFVHAPSSLKVVVDAGNGMAGPEVVRLMKKVPAWTFIPMYMEPDGNFPHHIANPHLPAGTRDLKRRVVEEQADIGVAFDGDADRAGFIDEKGEQVREDLVTALIADFLLSRIPGSTVLYDLRSSRIVPEAIAKHGGRGLRSRVGHAFIKAMMREENALFAGELSGHYYYRDMGFTDNALLTMIQMLNFLALRKRPLSGAVRPLMRYASTGEINIRVGRPEAIFAALEAAYANMTLDRLDGLTFSAPAWWFNLRASNTEPLLRLNLEADDNGLRDSMKEEVLSVIRKADPSMSVEE